MASPPDWSQAENSNNPADSDGLIHNLALYEVQEMDEAEPEEVYEVLLTFFENLWGEGFGSDEFESNFPIAFFVELLDDSTSYWHNTIDGTSFSSDAKDLTKGLIDLLIDTTSLNTDFSYEEIYAPIVNWEDELVVSGIEQEEIEALLHCSSVARYSMLYWFTKHEAEWEGMTPQEQQATTKKRNGGSG
jgi:hypothetical protein